MNKSKLLVITALALSGQCFAQEYIGQYSTNPYDPKSTSNPYGAGNKYDPKSVANPYGEYGSKYSNKSATNPYATDAPKLYDSEGNYHGKLSTNKYDPESTSNPYGQYGSKYSPDSINNPYGAGSKYAPESPNNPYGKGLSVVGAGSDSTAVQPSRPVNSWRPATPAPTTITTLPTLPTLQTMPALPRLDQTVRPDSLYTPRTSSPSRPSNTYRYQYQIPDESDDSEDAE